MEYFFNNFKFRYFLMILAVFMLNNCMTGTRLDIRGAVPSDLRGTYTLILYGCTSADDLKNLAILYPDDGPITFEVYSLKTDYTVNKGLSADQALKQAEQFLTCNMDYWKTQLSKIVAKDGTIVGYELRTLYAPYVFGMTNILNVDYSLNKNKVTVYIDLDPEIEKAIETTGHIPHRL